MESEVGLYLKFYHYFKIRADLKRKTTTRIFNFSWVVVYTYCVLGYGYVLNNPYPENLASKNILFSSFSQSPKHLDPARSYASDEYAFIAQIYEPPYEYHYLLRPYKLVPLSADGYITEEYFDINNNKLSQDAALNKIKYTLYTIKIKPNIYYQPHPALVLDQQKNYKYHNLSEDFIASVDSLDDFDYSMDNLKAGLISNNTRELEANDFLYQIKRLADPKNQSPIYGFMSKYIVGLSDLNKALSDTNNKAYINLNDYTVTGLNLIDKYTYQLKIHGKYPQFRYWFAMLFLAPMPWEADKFYAQKGLKEQNISLDTYPVGTGPFMLVQNNPNRVMVLDRNPYYNHGYYPSEGDTGDKENGLLDNAGKSLPFLDKAVFYLEKESIPIWNKFIQGYYDNAAISSDNFNQAVTIIDNKIEISANIKAKNIKLSSSVEPGVFYWGFNMLNTTIGGYTESAKKLRRAIALAFDVEEYINIFRNGRGIIAHSPIPPGISDYQDTYNSYLYEQKYKKKSLHQARQLLNQAGYKNGIDPATGMPLVINFDAYISGDPSDGARFNWMREQFEKLNIKLNIRATQYNKFQDKIRSGSVEMYMFGWNADYPDPENFLFLFLCEQGAMLHNGENSSNYCNKKFDELFIESQAINDSTLRSKYISEMIKILQEDQPWIFGFYNDAYVLRHGWMGPLKTLSIGNNHIKYISLNPDKRVAAQIEWNRAIFWPIGIVLFLLLIIIFSLSVNYYNKNHRPRPRI